MAPPASCFESPFAPLELSNEDAARIEQLALMMVQGNLAQYERYLGPGRRQVDERVWKFMRQRGDIRAYAERRRHKRKARSRSRHEPSLMAAASPPLSEDSSGFHSAPVAPDLPVVHVVGSVEGTLDDVVYGILNPTLDAMRIKTEYIRVTLGHIAVLDTLVTPTHSNPLHSLTIKWVENVQKAVLRPAVNNRDFVYIEATGITYTSAGERVGYHLLHSVHFPQTPELPSFVRGNMSVCGLYRQLPGRTDQVDVYFKGTLDPGGIAMRSLVVIAAVDVFIAIWKYIECSRLKKLAWLMRARNRAVSSGEYASSSSGGATSSLDSRPEGGHRPKSRVQQTQCVVCCKPPAIALLTELRRRHCSLCLAYICSACRIKKTLCHLTSAEGRLLQRDFAFCPPCYNEAIHADAFQIAQDEFAAPDAYALDSELFLSSDSSESARFSTTSLADSLFS